MESRLKIRPLKNTLLEIMEEVEKNIETEKIYENIEYDGFHTFYQVYVVLSLFIIIFSWSNILFDLSFMWLNC